MIKNLLNIDTNAKTIKGQKLGFLTGILYLAPANLSGHNVCPFASPGCKTMCLNTAGRGVFSSVQSSRIKKTKLLFSNGKLFFKTLTKNIKSLIVKAKNKNLIPVIRLNGTSDIPWEATGIMNLFPDVQFYDYTKDISRMKLFINKKMPQNYHLTFSLSETNKDLADFVLKSGANAAIVFNTKKKQVLPASYQGYKVIDGDLTDLRFKDPNGCIVGLRAKGKARRDTSGFVVNV